MAGPRKPQPRQPSVRMANVANDVARRVIYVRALYLAVLNDPDVTLQEVAVEFYGAVGEILEGKAPRQIEFNKIRRERVLALLKDGE